MRRLLLLLMLVAALGFVAPVWAGEAICPVAFGGSGTRADIVWCADFEVATACVPNGGQGSQCWIDNGFNVGTNAVGDGSWKILNNLADAAVGNSYAKLTVVGEGNIGVGAGVIREPTPGAPHNRMARRSYMRFSDGYVAFESGHGQGNFLVRRSAGVWDFSKSAEFKFQNSTFSGQLHFDGLASCGGGLNSLTITPNQGTWVPMQNNKWYRLEYQIEMDTVCSNQSTSPWSGCNGTVRFWQDDVLTHKHTGMNLGGAQCELQFYMTKPLQHYFHRGSPPWDEVMSIDNVVESNLSGLTPGDTAPIGAAANEYPNGRGSGDVASPYFLSLSYAAWLGRRTGGDCEGGATAGDFGEYNTDDNFRSSSTMVTLDPTQDNGFYVDQGTCVSTFAQIDSWGKRAGTMRRISDGSGAGTGQNCAGLGSTSQWCRWDGASWKVVASPAQALKSAVTSSGTGAGAMTGGPPQMAFPQYASYGRIKIPSQAANTAFSHLALAGWVKDITQNPTGNFGGHVSLTMASAAGGVCTNVGDCKWAIGQHGPSGTGPGKITTATQVTFDTWHEYEIIVWRNGTNGCASSNGCVSLMIDRARLIQVQGLPKSAAWMFNTAEVQFYPIIGVIDFQGTPTFTAYYDDNTITSASAWSCDGWGAASCPFSGLTGSTTYDIVGDRWRINGSVTYPNSPAEGLLMNARMVNAVLEDTSVSQPMGGGFDPAANTQEFINEIPSYVAHGIRAFTVGLQGGNPNPIGSSAYNDIVNSAFNSDGSLKQTYLDRVESVVRAADANGALVLLQLFYFRQDQILSGQQAILDGITNVCNWIEAEGFTNVALKIANEAGDDANYDHPAFESNAGLYTLLDHARAECPSNVKLSTSVNNGVLSYTADGGFGADTGLVTRSDFLTLHANQTAAGTYASQITNNIRPNSQGKPIIITEDPKGGDGGSQAAGVAAVDESVAAGAGWGIFIRANQAVNDLTDFFIFNGASDAQQIYTRIQELTTAATPSLAVSPLSLTFNGTAGSGNPANQSLAIMNLGTPGMSWSIADNASWLSVSPTVGVDDTVATVIINASGLTAGVHNAIITVTAAGASGSPATIPVTLNLAVQTPSAISSGRVR